MLLLALLSTVWASAENITEEQARQQALDFLASHQSATGSRRAPGTTPQTSLAGKVSGLYVYNIADKGGFVIVSNDDRTRAILGYSDSGSIDIANMPANMRAWLQGYADEIAWLNTQKASSPATQSPNKAPRLVGSHSTAAIEPMVTTTWYQDAPYNNLCPTYSGSNRSATGCVATAMAQVMNYHQWPRAATTAIPGYTTESYGINLTAGLPATTFDWSNMRASYSGSYSDDEATAVATLMQYCGYSVKMDYGPESGSNTDLVAAALKAYFDYNATTTKFVSRSFYTAAKWTDLIYHELASGRPVVYGGMSSGGGHEFVCDGYKYESNTDFFHINWGWGGLSDNYFVLSALDPDQQGIGGSTSDDGFHYGQDAVIGIQPSTSSGTTANVTPNVINLTLNSMTAASNPAYINVPVNITLNITNNSTDDYDGDIVIGNKYQNQGEDAYELLAMNNYTIAAGETKDIVIPFTPYAAGTFNLVFFLPNEEGSYSTDGVVRLALTVEQPTTNGYVPVYGYYCDEYSRSQFVIPAANLQDKLYAMLNGVTFYASNSSVSWGNAEFDVYLSEVNETTISELKDWSTLDKVYSGSLSISDGKMTITFDSPYRYTGGNLLVGINQTVEGSWSQCSWAGTTANGVSLGGYNSSVSQQNFLPTTTFDYTPGEAPAVVKPTGLTVSYTGGTTADVSWISTESLFDIDVNGTVTENVANPYTLTNLAYATDYTVKVRAKNDGGVSDWSSPVTFTTDLSDTNCQIAFLLTDSYGDGWNDAAIQVVDVLTGIVIGTVTNTTSDHSNAPITDTVQLSVPDDRDINFVWVSGGYDSECSFKIFDINGELIYEFEKDENGPSAGELYTYHVECTASPWRIPTNLAASEVGPHSAVLSWTENSNPVATAWVVAYKADGATDFTEVAAATNPYTLTGLVAETEYTVKVRPATDEATKWSAEITFTTDIATPAPINIAVNPAPTSAAVSWTGFADSYGLRYKVNLTPDQTFGFDDSTLDGWTTIDADGDGYSWEIYSTGTTYLKVAPGTGDGHNGSADKVVSGSYSNNYGALTPDNYLVSPQIPLGGTITFWAYGNDDTYYADHFGVAVSTEGNTDAADFTTIQEYTLDEGQVWKQYSVDLSAYAGQTGYVAIRHFGCTDQFLLGIDDIEITIPDDGRPWTTVENIDASSYEITGLEPATAYKVEVRGYFGSEEAYSTWTSSGFTTPSQCDAPNTLAVANVSHDAATLTWIGYHDSYNVHYRTAGGSEELAFDSFENGSAAWTQIGDGIFSGIPHSGEKMAVMGYNTTGTAQYLITTELPELESGSTLQFYQRYYSGATTFKVGFSTTTADADAFTWGDEQDAAPAYTLFSAEIPVGTKFIAIQHTSNAQENALFIDDCGIYSPYLTPGEWLTATTDEPTLVLSGLTPDTKYEWQAQGISESCGGTTEWSSSSMFATGELVELADMGDNSETVELYDKQTVGGVVLSGRTLYKDGKWNTLCLPFNVDLTADDCPLTGATARTVTAASITGTTLNLTFGDEVTTLTAGTPYIIKWANEEDIVSPVFRGVTFDATDRSYNNDADGDLRVRFVGTYKVNEFDSEDKSILLMGGANNLYYPTTGAGIAAQRAYFKIGSDELPARQLTAFNIDFGDTVTGIRPLSTDERTAAGGGWYTIDGRTLSGKPTQRGVYINNGKKVIIK